jgi:hypothetical protein
VAGFKQVVNFSQKAFINTLQSCLFPDVKNCKKISFNILFITSLYQTW